ncbi:MAG: hypothetical protein QM775_24395 [Pirellulales bacterium]
MTRHKIPNVGTFDREVIAPHWGDDFVVRYHRVADAPTTEQSRSQQPSRLLTLLITTALLTATLAVTW